MDNSDLMARLFLGALVKRLGGVVLVESGELDELAENDLDSISVRAADGGFLLVLGDSQESGPGTLQ